MEKKKEGGGYIKLIEKKKGGITFTKEAMRYMALFESTTNVTARDCIIDEGNNRIIYVINEGNIGKVIGRGGKTIHSLERMTNKKHLIMEYSEDPTKFIKNALRPAETKEVRITEELSGKKIAVIVVNPRDKAIAIGRNGERINNLRFLTKRYFQIDDVRII
jgi:N utilization substance protein A